VRGQVPGRPRREDRGGHRTRPPAPFVGGVRFNLFSPRVPTKFLAKILHRRPCSISGYCVSVGGGRGFTRTILTEPAVVSPVWPMP
jgi:hypothetical protein